MTDPELSRWETAFAVFLGFASMPLIVWAVVSIVSNLPT